jgi:sugar phosphate isomerase/epimerase
VRVGYNTNGLAHHRLEDALRLMADLGFEAVALTPDVQHLDPYHCTAAEVARIAALIARLRLVVVIETGARYVLDPAAKHRPGFMEPDEDARNRRVDFLGRCLGIATDLGATALSFFAGVVPDGVDGSAAQDRLAEGVARVLALASARGIGAGLEPEPGHAVETIAQYRGLRARVGPDLRLVLDVGHLYAMREPDPARVILERAADLVQVHLEDTRTGVHEHLLPGAGDVDFAAVKAALTASGYRGAVCFELSRSSHMAPVAMAACLRCWRSPKGPGGREPR